jgi:hypothetical protein
LSFFYRNRSDNMTVRSLLAGVALVGAAVSLGGCGGSDPETTVAPTPAATPAPPAPAPGPVQMAWDNHFNAFAAGATAGAAGDALDAALVDIMKDYDDKSVIAVFNDHCDGNKVGRVEGQAATKRDGYMEYKTLAEIKSFFSALFIQLKALENVVDIGPKGGGAVVMEGEDLAERNVFLTWRTSLTGVSEIKYATDSFSWSEGENGTAIIRKQNIVTTEPQKACNSADVAASECAGSSGPGVLLCDAWENHFAAFGAGAGAAGNTTEITAALDKIMVDYTDDSIVQVFDNSVAVADGYSTFKGDEIRGFFEKLFKEIDTAKSGDDIGLAVKLLEIEPSSSGVFLVWESLSHTKATDTFVFNTKGQIIRQNIVVSTKTGREKVMV